MHDSVKSVSDSNVLTMSWFWTMVGSLKMDFEVPPGGVQVQLPINPPDMILPVKV